jgi:hypothetical protein
MILNYLWGSWEWRSLVCVWCGVERGGSCGVGREERKGACGWGEGHGDRGGSLCGRHEPVKGSFLRKGSWRARGEEMM